MITNKFCLTVALTGALWLPSTLLAVCNVDATQTAAVSVYSLSGQGNFSCADLNMNPAVGAETVPNPLTSGSMSTGWTKGTAEEVDSVIVEDSSGKRCLYNYGPGSTGGSDLTPPADKPVADAYFCADGYVQPGPNTPPQVTITSPIEPSLPGGEEVLFAGNASDAEDGDLSGYIHWTSSRDGELDTGAELYLSDLSSGLHWITAQVIDSGGLIGSATISLQIEPLVAQNCVASEDGSSVRINGVQVSCPEPEYDASGNLIDDNPRLVCSADLSTGADKFEIGLAACCLCNAVAIECNPSLAEGDDPVDGVPPCPDSEAAKGALQVPTSLMFNNDPYYCYTVGGKRTCFYY